MKPAKNYAYSKENLEILSEALESLANLKVLLSKDNILDSDELLIKLNYQFLGNCLKKLTYSCIMGDEELKALIFWARAENPDRHSHLFDRMDTAHGTNFLWFVNPSNAFARDRARWLEECGVLTDLIKHRLSAADLKTNRRATIGRHDNFNLDAMALPHFRNGTVIENCLGNIYQALAIAATINVNAKTLPTPSNMAIILLANQVIGNNLKELAKRGYVLAGGQLTGAMIQAMIENRNHIAHATKFSSFLALNPSYFFNCYVALYQELREIIKLLATPLMILVEEDKERADAAPPQEEEHPPLERGNLAELRYRAHHELFLYLQSISLIDQDKKPKSDVGGKIFTDIELCYILEKLINRNELEWFSRILENLRSYTNIRAQALINMPMQYILKNYFEYDGVERVLYLPIDEVSYINIMPLLIIVTADGVKTEYPKITYVYLLESTCRGVGGSREHEAFMLKLLDLGANVNIKVTASSGIRNLLWQVWNNDQSRAKLLISHGADVNDSDTGETMLFIALKSPTGVDAVRELINLGADPRIEMKIGPTKSHLAASIVLDRGLDDQDACKKLQVITTMMVEKYGFEAVQAMLESKVSTSRSDIERVRAEHTTNKAPWKSASFVALKVIARNFVDVVNGTQAIHKPMCTKLINLLVGLNRSNGCELFKVVLTNKVEIIKSFLEAQSKQAQLALLEESFLSKDNKNVKVVILEFAKAFCDREVIAYLINYKVQLKKPLLPQVVSESKEGEDDSKENNVSTPLALSSAAAGVVVVAPSQDRGASASLCSTSPLPPLPPVISAESVQLVALATATLESKEGEDGSKKNNPQPPSPAVLGAAASMVAAAQPQERNASTSLSCVSANFINLDCRKALIVGALVAVCAALLFAELYQKRDYSSERMI